MKRAKAMKITLSDYLRFNRMLLREQELERNGGRWKAKDRPHKNKKKYNRKIVKKETLKMIFQHD